MEQSKISYFWSSVLDVCSGDFPICFDPRGPAAPYEAQFWGVEFPTIFLKRGRLDRISIFRGGLFGKKGVTFCRGGGRGCSFYMKKLKSEIFNNKKSL